MGKRKKHTPEQIVRKLREADRLGVVSMRSAARSACHQRRFDSWRKRYGNMSTDEVKELYRFKDENARLKRLVADKELDILALKEIAEGKW